MFKMIKRIVMCVFLFALIATLYSGYKIRENVKQVMKFEPLVTQEVENNNIKEHKDLVLAIIYTESKGKSDDLMQSSESAYGQQQMIGSPEESVAYGVNFLAQAIQKANENNCDIWTAIQAYNFGLEYISFVQERGGKNTVALAEEYSKNVLSPLLGNENKTTYRYYRPQALLHNGGFLYSNGGNMFYADIVKMNKTFINWFR
ncbi:lysozyme family protein [Enterococcus rivorum]|uniref:Transglycosylase SLT domain protein n=1 Tax=Enterococcus rivorum TaxID=762845 RepID=A0A1E5KT57_9ENTE|nr:lysozyme family protein [Enterococcus rivorum]MBP2098127.1 hypothetical protein [Enterococcus rivorum]OEH81064.1 transglycosylase SLT domain protein [Enterococcus rivorum]